MKASKDVLQIALSDMHSGSNYALFLGRNWQGKKGNNHYPTSIQIEIRAHWERTLDELAELRKGKRVVVVHDGDAIDGDHHNSCDVCSVLPDEQAEIHVELMNELQKRIKWQPGDQLYYTHGTPVHVGEWEENIGRELNAVPNGETYVHQFLEVETNGRLAWFIHHGPGRGEGANEGNNMRNWLRNIYMECVKDGRRVPDLLYTGHIHNPTYSSYVWRRGMEFTTIHGVIVPSWQAKTSYAYMRAPIQKNKIGLAATEIKADGTIATPRFWVMETR